MLNGIKICSVTKKYHFQLFTMLAVVKEVFVNGYTLYVYPKPYKSQVWRIFTDNKKFIAGNCVDYVMLNGIKICSDLKSKTVKKAEFQNCVECLSPFPWTDRLTVSLRMLSFLLSSSIFQI